MNTEEKEIANIHFRNVVTELKIPENCDAMPANAEPTIEFIVETY